jgi:hypothetical protein
VHVSVPDAKAQRTHKGQSIKFTNILTIFIVPKNAKIKKIFIDTNKWSQRLRKKNSFAKLLV